MNANIKTCVRCGAKNFANFASCFNCGCTEFIHGETKKTAESVVRADEAERIVRQSEQALGMDRLAVPPQAVAAEQNVFRQQTPQTVNAVPPQTVQPQTTIVPPTVPPQTVQPQTVNVAPQASAVSSDADRRKFAVKPVSKLNMRAQEEKRRTQEQVPPSGELFYQIVEKLSNVERKLDSQAQAQKTVQSSENFARSTASETHAAVSSDIAKLDREIEGLKNDNRQVMDLLVRTQKEQIEKLEAELSESNDRITALSEDRGKDRETLSYLDEERRKLEQQLTEERERFDMLLKDREQTKELREVGSLLQMDIPNDYVVYTGSAEDPGYIEYAKKQFLKIYPKIVGDAEHEDVIYYIPGEFRNPPVLVVNPNVAKNYVRNLKLNLVSAGSGETVSRIDAGRREIDGAQTANAAVQSEFVQSARQSLPPLQPVQAPPPVNVTVNLVQPEKVEQPRTVEQTAVAAEDRMSVRQSVQTHSLRPEHVSGRHSFQPVMSEEVYERVSVPHGETDNRTVNVSFVNMDADDRSETSSVNVMDKMVGGIDGGILDSKSITRIPDISQMEQQHIESRSRRTAAIVSVLIGVLSLASLITLILPYFSAAAILGSDVEGYQTVAAIWKMFSPEFENGYTAIVSIAPGALAPFVIYAMIAMVAVNLAACIVMLLLPRRGGAVKVIKLLLLFLAFACSAFTAVCAMTQFGSEVTTGYGLWIKTAVDLAAFVLAAVFMNVKKVREELDDIRPLDIVTTSEEE